MLSADTKRLATHLQLIPDIERLLQLQDGTAGVSPADIRLEMLSIKHELVLALLSAMLKLQEVTSAIDHEIAHTNLVREFLEDRRDRAIKYNSVANIVSGALGAALGNSLDMARSTGIENTGDLLELTGGAAQASIASLALRLQAGERRKSTGAPTMLSPIFDRPGSRSNAYPEFLWQYLNSAPSGSATGRTRREELITKWIHLGLLRKSSNSRLWNLQVDELLGLRPGRRDLTINNLESRALMLADVRATAFGYLKHFSEIISLIHSIKTPRSRSD